MRYLYAFIFLIGSFTLSSYAYSESRVAECFLPDLVFDSILMHSDRCGEIVLEGWSLWEGGECLGFSYTYTSENCRTITVEGLTPPNGLLNPNKKVNINFFAQVLQQNQPHQQYQQYQQSQQQYQ